MPDWLTSDNILEAVEALQRNLTYDEMREVIGRDLERMVARTESAGGPYQARIPEKDLAQFLVDLKGTDLLNDKEIRHLLVKKLHDDHIKALSSLAGNIPSNSKSKNVEQIINRRWHAGKSWARHFASFFGFPKVFAGITGISDGPDEEEIEAHIPLPDLHDYQQDLLHQVIHILESPPGENRAILSLPTGAGKTRTAVEAVINWWNKVETTRSYIIWIAQSDELCEQAAEAFREIWIDRGGKGPRKILHLFRYWGSHKTLPDSVADGVIVASIQKLNEATQDATQEEELSRIAEDTAAIVIDEAHHASASSYTHVLAKFNVTFGRDAQSTIPLLGLTATPYRGTGAEENRTLARRFHSKLLTPRYLGEDPLNTLRDMGILSRVKHRLIQTGRSFTLDENELKRFNQLGQLPDSFLQKIGRDYHRNALLLKALLELPLDWPILCFGCSLEHASALAVLLRRKGRKAAFISGETRRSTRRHLIEEFRDGNLQILCNYGVLTTGFDAPRISAVVIARPTTSVVLYEQMIGRGMRGPLNGGTEECLVIDLEDNIKRFKGQMAYKRMEEFWK